MIVLNRKCPICGSGEGEELHRINHSLPDNYPMREGYEVVSCSYCGFTFANVDTTQEDYNRYYSTCNMYCDYDEIRDTLTGKINSLRLEVFKKHIPRDSSILDIGFGGGALLKALQANGYSDLTGIDPSSDSVECLIKNTGIKATVGNIFDKPSKEYLNRFDVICATMVTEHIYDLKEMICCLRQYVKKDTGMIFLDVPNVEGFKRYLCNPANYFNHEHINYFSLQSLDNLLAVGGFKRCISDEECIKLLETENPEEVIEALYIVNDGAINNGKGDETQITKDMGAADSIVAYFASIPEMESERIERIKEFITDTDEDILVWGTGSYCMKIIGDIPELKEKVKLYVDNNITKQGTEFHGKTICAPDELCRLKRKFRILVLVMLQSDDVVKQIKDLGVECQVLVG